MDTNNISVNFLQSLLNNDNALNFVTSFIQDIDDISIINDKNLKEQLKNEIENKQFIKQFFYDNGNIKIYSSNNFGYIKVIENNHDLYYII